MLRRTKQAVKATSRQAIFKEIIMQVGNHSGPARTRFNSNFLRVEHCLRSVFLNCCKVERIGNMHYGGNTRSV